MPTRDEIAAGILSALKTQLKDQWNGLSDDDKALLARVSLRGAKLAEAEAAGDTAYVEKHSEAFEAMVKDLEAVAAIETATFANALLDTGLDILVKVGKKLIGLP